MATTLRKDNLSYDPGKMEQVNCPFCETTAYKVFEYFGTNKKYRYVKCSNCGCVYLNPRPKYNEEFKNTAYEDYDVDSAFFTSNGDFSKVDVSLIDQQQAIIDQIQNKLGKKGRLLEIGCMTGLFLKVAKDNGWDVVGVDVSKKMIDHINKNLGIKAYNAKYEDLIFKDPEKFDVIYCSHVIEHIPYPNVWMKKFKKDLKNNGLLVINVPNQYSIDRVIKRFVNSKIIDRRKWDEWRTPDHMYEPTIASMKFLLNKHKFNILDHFTYSKKEGTKKPCLLSKLFHHQLKLGSKLRLFCN